MMNLRIPKTIDDFLLWVSVFVLLFSVLVALPAVLIPIGLPPEGDGVDYRIPILKFMLKHHSYPNWPATVVDDFPMFGELMMLPFYAISPGLGRIIPILAYLGCAVFGGLIAQTLTEKKSKLVFWASAAWIIGLRPLAIQSNLFMTDNVASCFCLGSLYFLLNRNYKTSALLTGLACATRYMIWGPSLGIVLALIYLNRKNKDWVKILFLFCVIAVLGPLPNMIRNYLVNGGNPFFPVFLKLFGQENLNYEYGYSWHGRGKNLWAFLLLPFDFLYTNTFVNGFFDYTVGKLFYLQFFAVMAALIIKTKTLWVLVKKAFVNETVIACAIFFTTYLLYWFFSSQQMRFFIADLVLANIFMFFLVFKAWPKFVVMGLILLGMFSALSIQKDSFRILKTGELTSYEPLLSRARACLSQIPPESSVGFTGRGIVGFFDFETYLLPPVGYALNIPKEQLPQPDFIFESTYDLYPNYKPWPEEKPCLFKRASI